jgi:murein DD-endopeptidase MepM/ murein hydrolase activator NlpD
VVEPDPIVVEFPLRGEWVAYHTPAARVPSHGIDQLGQRYAYDFLRIERNQKGWKFFRTPTWRYHLVGVPLEQCFAWGEPIHAPFGGVVTAARDGWPERDPVHFVRDLAIVLKNAMAFDPLKADGLAPVLGNYVVLKMLGKEVYALMAHARAGSVRVREGDDIQLGQHLAEVGHSGNSTAPHLHFQLMDGPNVLTARGLPCSFREYQALRDGAWAKVTGGMPDRREFVRYAAGTSGWS